MPILNGNVTMRAKSQDYKILQIFEDDGVTPINLTNATVAVLRLKNIRTGGIKVFSTEDIPKLLFFLDRTLGKIQLRPSVDSFPIAEKYNYHLSFTDSIGEHPAPEDKNYSWDVIERIALATPSVSPSVSPSASPSVSPSVSPSSS